MSEKDYHQYRPHPWHGLTIGEDAPNIVTAYIESTPMDVIKYEVDKETGYLMIDRPHKLSAAAPFVYGFIPQTYCGENVKALTPEATEGDGDPLDILVFSERPIERADIILKARIIGGMSMLDGGEADDKIIAILDGDKVFGDVEDIDQFPKQWLLRSQHYFDTYKAEPGKESDAHISAIYDKATAIKVLEASIEDYKILMGK